MTKKRVAKKAAPQGSAKANANTHVKTAAKTAAKTGLAPGYLHGFTNQEQDRLYRQAQFFEPYIYSHIHFPAGSRIVEIGCGVGAQTEIMLRRYPNVKITGVDASEKQLARATQHLKAPIRAKTVELKQADALHLPAKDNTFDGAFVCWLLEHVTSPVDILKEARRVLKGHGVIHCTETLNSSFYVHPYSPAILKYWFEFDDHQWNMKGDPFMGAKLGNHLLAAGFQDIQTQVITLHFDNRTPKLRQRFIEDWTDLLLSAAPDLIRVGKVTPEIVTQMKAEMERLKRDPDAVAIYSFVHATAQSL